MKKAVFGLLEMTAFLTRPFWNVFFMAITSLPLSANRVALANLRQQLGVHGIKARKILAQVHQQYACYFLELVFLWPLGLLRTQGAHTFGTLISQVRTQYALRDDQGIVMLGAHYANIEAVGDAMRQQFAAKGLKPFCVLAKPSRFPWINTLLEKVRQNRGFLVLWTGGPTFASEFEATMKSGKGLALLVDQKPKKGGVFVRFFEDEAAFPDKGVQLALRHGMAFVHVTMRRLSLGRFEMICEEGCNTHLTQKNTSPKEVFEAYAKWLEGVIRTEPGQWSWDYRKWSRKAAAHSTTNTLDANTTPEVAPLRAPADTSL